MVERTHLHDEIRMLERRIAAFDCVPALLIDVVDTVTAETESSLHEIGHVVTLRGSLAASLAERVEDIDEYMRQARIQGIIKDEYEISTLAVELLVAQQLGLYLPEDLVADAAWDNGNVTRKNFRDHAHFRDVVRRRMHNVRCQRLAQEVSAYLMERAG